MMTLKQTPTHSALVRRDSTRAGLPENLLGIGNLLSRTVDDDEKLVGFDRSLALRVCAQAPGLVPGAGERDRLAKEAVD